MSAICANPFAIPKQTIADYFIVIGLKQTICKCLPANDLRQIIHSNITRRVSAETKIQ
ncbi:MAG TPA: hypothetical protein VJ063_14145 [Verrucomicrobiae bacterium]|nr:hypothetical protein [Verrucomicrobiae bacterium]